MNATHADPTRIQFTKGETYLVDALRYPAARIQGAPSVLLMLIGGPSDKAEVRKLAMQAAGEVGLSLEANDNLLVIGINAAQAEAGADALVREIQRKLDAAN
jgi:hypothetical protein